MIDITGLDKATVLAALYNHSKPQGMGFLHFDPTPMTPEEAATHLQRSMYTDYLKGRIIKVDLKNDEFNEALYDRDLGSGAAAEAVDSIR
jgi:hypothetical protein